MNYGVQDYKTEFSQWREIDGVHTEIGNVSEGAESHSTGSMVSGQDGRGCF